MKVVFVGPTLAKAQCLRHPGIEFRPPAVRGDIMVALNDGATVIGLIDGQFEYVAPVWHKELLHALKCGVAVFGASSMGALRAAECEAFGMRGIGEIYADYASGQRIDDADVALLHAPPELGYAPLTVPLVNVDATLGRAGRAGLLVEEEICRLHQSARHIHFKDRTWKGLAEMAEISWQRLQWVLERCFTDQKQLDALELLAVVSSCVESNLASNHAWSFNPTPLWRELYDK